MGIANSQDRGDPILVSLVMPRMPARWPQPKPPRKPPADAGAHLRALIESTRDMIWSVDLNYRLVTFNKALSDEFKYNHGIKAKAGLGPVDLLTHDRAALWPPLYERALKKGPFQTEYRRADGGYLELELNPIVENGKKTGVWVVCKDITERKAARQSLASAIEALRATEERYHTAFETCTDSITISRMSDGMILDANKAFLDFFGFSREEIVGRTAPELRMWVEPRERDILLETVRREGKCRNLEVHTRLKSGEIVWTLLSASTIELDGTTCLLSVGRDITGQKTAEQSLAAAAEALRVSEARYRAAFQTSTDAISIVRLSDRKHIDVNPAFLGITGFRREEVIGQTLQEIGLWANPSDEDTIVDLLQRTSEVRDLEFQYRRKNGTTIWGLTSAAIIEIDSQPHVLAITRDITERKQAEAAIIESRAKLEAALASMTDAVLITDAAGEFIHFNEAFANPSGFGNSARRLENRALVERVEMLTLDGKVVPLEGRPTSRALRGETAANVECKMRRTDTGETWIGSYTFSPIRGTDGAIMGAVVVGRDITEQKQAEAALLESRAKLEAALASMTDAVFISDTAGKLLEFNEAYARFHKFKNKAECGTTIEESRKFVELLGAGGEPEPIETRPALRALRGESGADVEYTLRRKDTGETWIGSYSYAPIRDKDGAITGAVAIARDVTEKKRAETALRESEEFLREAQRIAGLGVHVQDFSTGAWSASDVLRGILGAGPDDDLSFPKLSALVHPEDRAAFGACFTEDTLRKGKPFDLEHRIIRKSDRNVRWVRAVGHIENDSHGNPVKVRGTVRDITERKLEQAALRESKELLRLFIEQAPVALAMFDREMRYLAVSRHWLTQYDLVGQEIIGRSHYEIHLDLPERFKEAHRRGLAGETVKSDEDRYNQADGKERWVRWQIVPWRAGDGSVGGILIFAEDITERKASQEALERAEQTFRGIFEAAPEGIFQTTPAGKLLAVNPAGAIMLGYSSWENPNSVVHDLAHDIWLDPRERARFMEHLERHGEVEGFSCQVKCKDGAIKWVSISARKICSADGKTLYYQGFIEDLTSRMAAEEARRKAEQQFREIFDDAPEGIFQTSPEGRVVTMNPASAEMLGYESAAEAVAAIQDAAHDLWVCPEERAGFTALIEQQGTLRDYQYRFKRKDGKQIWLSATVKKIAGPDGKTICYQGFNQDITEQKRLEAALRANSRELELLSEINSNLVRAKTEKDLLRNCCRIMVEIGGYRAAWVGFAGEGPDKPIVTIADYGFEEGFLEGINSTFTWAETGHEDGPVGRSLRTGEVQVEEDICADPLVHSWRTESRKARLPHGHRAPFPPERWRHRQPCGLWRDARHPHWFRT